MQSNSLNAAQLLMSFMDTEQGKLSRKITNTGFSQELEAEQSKLTRNASGRSGQFRDARVIKNHFETEIPHQKVLEKPNATAKARVEKKDKSFGRRAAQKKQSRLSEEKVKKSLVFTNPVAVEKIIGQLQIPAESRKACMNATDDQGRISIKALASVLNDKSGSGQAKMGQPMVAAEDVQSLVKSLQQTRQDSTQSLPQLEIKPNGTYTLKEFRELLDRIAQQVASAEAEEDGPSGPASQASGQNGPEMENGLDAPSNISPDHVERLSTNPLPSFVREDPLPQTGNEGVNPSGKLSADATKMKEVEGAEQRLPSKQGKTAETGVNTLQTPGSPDVPEADSHQKGQGSVQEKISVDHRQAPPESQTAHSQAPSVKLPDASGTENPSIQWEAPGRGISAGNSPSVNLVSSLASVIDGKVNVKSVAGNESAPQTTFDPMGNLAESASQGQRVLSAQESNLGAWQQEQEMAGKNQGGNQPATNTGVIEKPGFTLSSADQINVDLQQNQPLGPASPGSQGSATMGAMGSGSGDPLSGGVISCHLATWPEALSYRMRQLHQQGRSRMTLELEPKSLGRLSLRIETHQNNVSAFISTESEQAKALLLQHSAALRQHLQEQGLQLGQFFVEVRQDGSSSRRFFQNQGSERRVNGGPQTARSSDKNDSDAVSSGVYDRRDGQQLISLFA